MVRIPEGIFKMGGQSEENSPIHAVAVERFDLDVAEVTMKEYKSCIEAGVCKPLQHGNPFCNDLHEGRDDHPVNCIDWFDAEAYCKRAGKRLPSEREWEYAASGGAEQRFYSWGNEEPERSRSCYSHEGTCPIKTYGPGAFGLYDMTGNVWEWTSSWYGTYPLEAQEGRARIARGGSWSRRFAKWMRNNLRNRFEPNEWTSSLGFRCAKDVLPVTCPSGSTANGMACQLPEELGLCAPDEVKVGSACVPRVAANGTGPMPNMGGPLPSSSGVAVPSASGESPAPTAAASSGPIAISRNRSPGFDDDCAHISPSMPVAYEFRGGGFHDREPLVKASGCKKRDVGVQWTSVCCPG
jgi:hypothetical protein